ncbi:hypothetical protein [Pseudonocardia sp. NPDC049154]|uniref:DUF3817 domain-containing protein n=1 Tax=Pseudonocardia sp. NPDC049154 TaxID=3155501 RepID=UPI0033E49DC7
MLTGLRAAAVVEAASLAVLLLNLATVHLRPVTQLAGPVHGCAYLAAIVLALSLPALPVPLSHRDRALALVPGIGGWLVLRRAELNSP